MSEQEIARLRAENEELIKLMEKAHKEKVLNRVITEINGELISNETMWQYLGMMREYILENCGNDPTNEEIKELRKKFKEEKWELRMIIRGVPQRPI